MSIVGKRIWWFKNEFDGLKYTTINYTGIVIDKFLGSKYLDNNTNSGNLFTYIDHYLVKLDDGSVKKVPCEEILSVEDK